MTQEAVVGVNEREQLQPRGRVQMPSKSEGTAPVTPVMRASDAEEVEELTFLRDERRMLVRLIAEQKREINRLRKRLSNRTR